MRLIISRVAAVLILTVCAWSSSVHAGWVMTESDSAETYVSKGMLKSSWETGGMILNGHKGTLIMYDDQREIYTEGTVEEFCEFTSSVFEQMLQEIPAEQREMMKKMMGGSHDSSPPQVVINKEDTSEKVAGFATDKYMVMVNGELYEELWVTTEDDLLKDFKPLMGIIAEFMSCSKSMALMGQTPPEGTAEYIKLMKTGVILKSVSHKEDAEEDNTDVINLVKKDVPDTAFKTPDGFRKVEFGELMRMGMEME